MADTKPALQGQLEKLGEDTSGTKAELEERLDDARVAAGLAPDVFEADPALIRENEKLAGSKEHQDIVNPEPHVYEARKTQ